MTKGPVRILHLSDFHFSSKTEWDRTPLLKALPGAVKELEHELPPDLVVITGDIAHSGKKDEYDLAQAWLDKKLRPALPKGFRKDRILIVPGNHDVDQDAVGDAAKALQDALLKKQSPQESQEKIARVLGKAGEREVLLTRHAAYLRFANSYRTSDQKLDVPWWSTTLRIKDCRLHVVGLCSTWMSCSDQDSAHLLIGRWQVNKVFDDAPDDADFRIAMVHHPWADLARFDREEMQEKIRRKADIILRGHRHIQHSETLNDPDRCCIELTTGTVYDRFRHVSAFQLIELFPANRGIKVHYRTWRSDKWLPDLHAYEKAPEGVAEISLAKGPVPLDPGKYLKNLLDDTQDIDIRGLQVGSEKAHTFSIEDLYIPLTTSAGAQADRGEPADDMLESAAGRERRVELHEVLKNRCVVITGDPGAGKTTFLRRIANLLCRALIKDTDEVVEKELGLSGRPFPVFIRMAELAKHIAVCQDRKEGPALDKSPAWLAQFLAATSDEYGWGLDDAFFRGQLENGSALVLLDGLDEVPTERQRNTLTDLVQRASQGAFGQCRFVVTSRPAAYRDRAVLPRFEHARIDDLEEEAIETFLEHWCGALHRNAPAKRKQHLAELLEAFRGRPEIRHMARNPVMLTALAVVHWNEKRLPEQRADLYESIIGWLAKARESREGRSKPDRCIELLQNLALAMHSDPKGRQVQVSRHWGARAIAPLFRGTPEDERVGVAEAFLRDEEVDSGIVVGRGEREIRFWHLTFQEYLAARALAGKSERVQTETLLATEKLYQPEWREVVLLFADVLQRGGMDRVDGMFETILDQVDAGASLAEKAQCVGLLGAVLRDLAPLGYEPGDGRYAAMAKEVMAIFDAKQSEGISTGVAIEAAEAIGRAGDPRFADPKSEQDWVTIPAGRFLMGAQKEDASGANYDSEAGTFLSEWPVHEVRLPEYHISRYPVTVSEYERFVDDGGYANEELWQADGFRKWQGPEKWDGQKAHPNRPVVGVSWFEASGYAAWAECRLPTEAEWERAARGTEGRRYPWGDDPLDPALANYAGNIGNPTPVGVYPRGATPDGIIDLAGNVWEWCQDVWHGSYEGAPTDGSAWETGGNQSGRVLRGGAWSNNEGVLRSAYRHRNGPDGRNDYVGFRLAAGTYPLPPIPFTP